MLAKACSPAVCSCAQSPGRACRYDVERGIARLQEGWVSAAAAKQRRGRAGRVRPGVCYKMFSRRQAASLQERCLIRAALMWPRHRVLPYKPGNAVVFPWMCARPLSNAQRHPAHAPIHVVQAQQLPEVLRMPLESLCLSMKVCLPHIPSMQEALARLLSPPTEQAVAAAVQSLKVRQPL